MAEPKAAGLVGGPGLLDANAATIACWTLSANSGTSRPHAYPTSTTSIFYWLVDHQIPAQRIYGVRPIRWSPNTRVMVKHCWVRRDQDVGGFLAVGTRYPHEGSHPVMLFSTL